MSSRLIMIGIADIDSQYCIPFYQNFNVTDSLDIKSLAKALAVNAMYYKRFVFKAFPVGTKWDEADRVMEPLWKRYKS